MSHFTRIKTKIVEREFLLKALAELGFANAEAHDHAAPLYGYQGDQRPDRANVIIRRQYVGAASNDIGFQLQHDGTYEAIISGYDRAKYSQEWLDKLQHRYAYHATKATLEEQGFTVTDEAKDNDGRIHLMLRRMV